MSPSYDERLHAFVGRQLSAPKPGQDPVNVPMIRHWVEAMGDTNPVYLSDEAARATGRDGIVAPASMMQAWTMRGYAATVRPTTAAGGFQDLVDLLDEGGYTSVVATDSDFELVRELRPGDHVSAEEVVEEISPEKKTALGVGRFVTTLRTYRDAGGAVVATQRWRTLRFRPSAPVEPRPLRPRPAVNPDNAFWFEAAAERRLVVQRCASCGTLRHPPRSGWSSSAARRAARCDTRRGRAARSAGRSRGRPSRPRGRRRSTATWWPTTRGTPPSTTRCWSRWSSSRRAPA